MKPLIFSLVGIIFSSPAFANDCDLLNAAIKIDVLAAPQSIVRTGDKVNSKIKVTLVDPSLIELFPPMEGIPLYFGFANSIEGSATLSSDWDVALTDLVGDGKIFETAFLIPPNFSGRYTAGAGLSFFANGCMPAVIQIPMMSMDIMPSDVSVTDIEPPVITLARASRNEAVVGDSIRISTIVSDKNRLCDVVGIRNGLCTDANWHVSFTADDGSLVNLFAENRFDDSSQSNYVDLILSSRDSHGYEQFKPGTYTIRLHDLSDIWGNRVYEFPEEQAMKVLIR